MDDAMSEGVPAWVPGHVQTYLAHVVEGRSIRALARTAGCHASTVLRQVRRCEQRRDDPLIDLALRRLGRERPAPEPAGPAKGNNAMGPTDMDTLPEDDAIEGEARRVLRRLAEPGACLAVAAGMDTAVVVREGRDGNTIRTGTVATAVAEILALRDWIAVQAQGRVARYRITPVGRSALKDLLARDESAQARARAEDETSERRTRYGAAESPLLMLARRRDKDGTRFLEGELVRAGERLREEYELASMGAAPAGGWESLALIPAAGDPDARGPDGARARLARAMNDLGPGLGDVVLRVCCQLEGLETVERRMGWAARSGKIVLRIGLQRLARHFAETAGPGGGLIG